MDLSVRDWMIIIGVLLAVAVLLDGFRRMRKERGDTIRLAAKRRREARDCRSLDSALQGSSSGLPLESEPDDDHHPSSGGPSSDHRFAVIHSSA